MLRKVVLGILLALTMSSVAYAGQWVQQGEDWYYQEDDGSFAKNKVIDGYYVAYNGRMINYMGSNVMRGVHGAFDMAYHGKDEVHDIYGNVVYIYGNVPYLFGSGDNANMWGNGCPGLTYTSWSPANGIAVKDVDGLRRYLRKLNEIIASYSDKLLLLDDVNRAIEVSNIVRSIYTYDISATWSYDYEALETGRGACQQFAQLYCNLCNMVGIDCELVKFDQYNHSINLVTIHGQKYWIDTTQESVLIPVGGGSRYDNAQGCITSYGTLDF